MKMSPEVVEEDVPEDVEQSIEEDSAMQQLVKTVLAQKPFNMNWIVPK